MMISTLQAEYKRLDEDYKRLVRQSISLNYSKLKKIADKQSRIHERIKREAAL